MMERMDLIGEVWAAYPFQTPVATFLRHNENMTYYVEDGAQKYLLRIHQEAEGLNFSFSRGDTPRRVLIEGEITLLNLLLEKNVQVQRPIANKEGKFLTELSGGELVTVLTWLPGEDLSKTPQTPELVFEIGEMIGRFHNAMEQLPILNRYRYDGSILELVRKEMTLAYEQNHIEERHFLSIQRYLNAFQKLLAEQKSRILLVHADHSNSNMVRSSGKLIPIDFSLSGYALPEMDLAAMIINFKDEGLSTPFLAGYHAISRFSADKRNLDFYGAFSVLMYLACHHAKEALESNFPERLDRWCVPFFDRVVDEWEDYSSPAEKE